MELDPFLLAHIQAQHAGALAAGSLRLVEADMNTLVLEELGASVMVLYLLPAALGGLAPSMGVWLATRSDPVQAEKDSQLDTAAAPDAPPRTPCARRIVTIDYPVPGWRVQERKDLLINGYPKALYYYAHPTLA